MKRPPGISVRSKLALSYAAFLLIAGMLMLTVVWLFLLRYVPQEASTGFDGFVPGRRDLVRAFAPAAAWSIALLLVVGVCGGWLLAGRMLAPLTKITDAARGVASGSFARRIQLAGRRDELRELADAFDLMLDTVETHVAEQQRFAANASHELRTPLAITQSLLEVALRSSERDHHADLNRLLEVNTRSREMTEALLLLSRAGHRVTNGDEVDLSLMCEQAVETLLPLAESHDVELSVTGEIALASGSPALLQQLTINLLHNAIVHNTAANGKVWLHTTGTGSEAMLRISNTGPTVDAALLPTLTEPFLRGTTRNRAHSHQGSGLGLSIVDRIVTSHNGSLRLNARAEGGLDVVVSLPRTQPENRVAATE